MNNILIIGCGHMGSALLDLWSKENSNKFTIVDPLRFKIIKNKFNKKNIKVFNSPKKIKNFQDFDIVVLAVTPQNAEIALKDYKLFTFKKNCVLISIMAGKKIIFLKKLLPSMKQVIRVMPNMPALIGQGVSCLVCSKFVSQNNKNKATKLFDKVIVSTDDKEIAKISIVGVGMRSHAGVATRMFDCLASENINIQMISTSEIKISVVVAEKYMELAVRSLHSEFELDSED